MNLSSFKISFLLNATMLFFVAFSFSQNNFKEVSIVTYKLKVIDNLENQDLENSTKKRIETINEASNLIECKLQFNAKESVFYQVKKMSLDNDQSYKLASIFIRGLYYKSLKDSIKILNKNFSGKNFNIVIPLNKYKWQITNQVKKIGNYDCRQAVLVESDLKITAWFTTDIPVPFGPNGIDGLPGLILETITNDRLILYATHINLKNNEGISIEKPHAERTITEREFLEIAERKMTDFFNEN